MNYKNAKRILDGYIEDTRGVAFSAYTSLTRGETRHGSGADWKDGKRIRARVPARDRVKIGRNTWLERGECFRPPALPGHSVYGYGAATRRQNYPDNTIGVRLHDTYIVIHTPHWTELNTGGWATMTTRKRMESFSQVQIGASRGGWAVYLRNDNVPCYCTKGYGREEIHPGKSFAEDPENPGEYGYVIPCYNCKGKLTYAGFDHESGGHPYFDGIRISPDGKRLMRSQPNKPESFEPIYTESGFTGLPLTSSRSY